MLYGSKSVSAHRDHDKRKIRIMLWSQVCQSCLLIFPCCLDNCLPTVLTLLTLQFIIYIFIYLVMMAPRRSVVVVTVVLNKVGYPFEKGFKRIG